MEDACQRRRGRDLVQTHRAHLFVNADRSVVQAGGLQRGTHCHGLFLELIAQLRRTRPWAPAPRLEHRGRSFGLDALAQLAERLAGDAVLGIERSDGPAWGVLRPLRDREADSGIDGIIGSYRRSLAVKVPPSRPLELSPMS